MYFKKMPFGLVNAPATFQRLMEIVLAGLARDCCLVYLDDVVVLGKTMDEHQDNLTKVFSRLREAGLKLKPKKCRLTQQEVEYLGHLVTKNGISTDPKKLEAVRNFPTTNICEVFEVVPESCLILQEVHTKVLESCWPSSLPHQEEY